MCLVITRPGGHFQLDQEVKCTAGRRFNKLDKICHTLKRVRRIDPLCIHSLLVEGVYMYTCSITSMWRGLSQTHSGVTVADTLHDGVWCDVRTYLLSCRRAGTSSRCRFWSPGTCSGSPRTRVSWQPAGPASLSGFLLCWLSSSGLLETRRTRRRENKLRYDVYIFADMYFSFLPDLWDTCMDRRVSETRLLFFLLWMPSRGL